VEQFKWTVPLCVVNCFYCWLAALDINKFQLRAKFTQCGEKEYFTSGNLIFVLDCQNMGIIS